MQIQKQIEIPKHANKEMYMSIYLCAPLLQCYIWTSWAESRRKRTSHNGLVTGKQ